MLTVDLSPEAEALLDRMARETGRTREEIARRALLDVMEDYEDAKLADERRRTFEGSVPWEEVRAHLLDDVDAK